MQILTAPAAMQQAALAWRRAGKRIGLVPTMGFLHEGHLSLVRLARQHADAVVLSLFVNPTQFGPAEDFGRYPRAFERDCALCEAAGVDVIFHPEPEAMYPAGHSVFVVEDALSKGLCGGSRPGHFRGVLTVVAKLFNLTQPDVAVFGQKDAQQARVIRQLARDLNFPVAIVLAPIVREPEGLAMSSRNAYLSPAERCDALCLSRALKAARRLYRAGEREAGALRAAAEGELAATPAARIDYVALVDADTLQPVERAERPILLALAAWIGKTRLIDNLGLPDDTLSNLPE